jgi:hypothetical protein
MSQASSHCTGGLAAPPALSSESSHSEGARVNSNACLKDLRQAWYRARGLPADGGDSLKWVDFRLKSIPLPFPNSDARRAAVRFHDLHHILTGYTTDIRGEFEISAWELAGGCGRYWVAWHLNLLGLLGGLCLNPGQVWRAFLRGRRSKTLYRGFHFESVLNQTPDSMRQALALPPLGATTPARFSDAVYFVATVSLASVITLLTAAVVLAPVSMLAWITILLVWKRQARLATAKGTGT